MAWTCIPLLLTATNSSSPAYVPVLGMPETAVTYFSYRYEPQQSQPMARLEMKGPRNTDIDNILSGLKSKNVDIHEKKDEESVVSVTSLKDLESGAMPKKSKGHFLFNFNKILVPFYVGSP